MEGQERGIPTVFVIPFIQLVVVALLFLSLLFGQRNMTALTILVLGMAGGTKLWAMMSLKGLKCRLAVDKRKMFAGEKLTLRIQVENGKLLPLLLQIKVPVDPSLHPSSTETVLTKETSLLWYQRFHFQWELTARRRGVHQIGPLTIFAGDPFAFFSRRERAGDSYHILVYPRLVPLKSFPLPRHDFFGCPGAKSPVNDPVYILGTRDYQPGQSARYIHWKASARHDILQEKVFEPTKQEKVLLVVDVEQFAAANARRNFERTLEVVASLALKLDRGGHAVGLVTNGMLTGGGSSVVAIARSHRQLPAILEVLARLEMKPRMGLVEMMRSGLNLTWGVSGACFSYDDGAIAAAEQYFSNRKTPVVFFLSRRQASSEKDRPKLRREIRRIGDIYIETKDGQ
jgi:uncharacterized protein (DUF58 family)